MRFFIFCFKNNGFLLTLLILLDIMKLLKHGGLIMGNCNVNGMKEKCNVSSTRSSSDPVVTYLNAISRFNVLSKEEELSLFKRYASGDEAAYNQIVEANLRAVVKISRRYMGRGIALLDLIEEGNLGLLHAIKKFEVDRGFRFSTYAVWWIKRYIERAIMDQSNKIRLPVHVIKKLSAYLNAEMGKSETQSVSCEEIAEHFDVEVDRVHKVMQYKLDTKSLDDLGHADSDTSLTALIEDPKSIDPLAHIGNESTKVLLLDWLNRLDELDRMVIVQRFGLEGHDSKTLEEVGQEIGLTRERVRQIQLEALAKMRRAMNFSGIDISEANMGASKQALT